MKTLPRISAFLMVVLAAAAWPFLTTVFEAPAPAAGLCLLALAVVLAVVACRGLSDPTDAADPRWLACALLAVAAALVLPRPAWHAGVLLAAGLALGVLFRRRAGGRNVAAGIVLFAVVMLAQAAVLCATERLGARTGDLPVFASLIAGLLRFVGADAAASDGTVAVVTLRETFRFPATLGLLGFPTMPLALAGALIAGFVLTPPGRRLRAAAAILVVWLVYLPVRAALCLALFLQLQMFVDYFADTVRVDVLYGAWWQLATLVPLGLSWGLLRRAPAPDTARTAVLGSFRPRPEGLATLAALAGAALLAFSVAWHEAGAPAAKRVIIDEGHSDWEKSTLAPGTRWYGIDSMYNMFSIIDYLGYFYEVNRNTGPLDGKTLDGVDVLILKTPTKPYSADEISAVVEFVRRGGGLYAIGEHTNYVGSSVYLNSILTRMGISLREDCVFNLVDKSPFVEVWDRPDFGVHPIVANVPRFRFEVSCSVAPRSPRVDDVMVARGMYRLNADYFMENYYPMPTRGASMRFGSFTQDAARDFGRGRVAVFTDSTTMSNFSSLYPGRAELMLGTVDWLGRTHTRGLWRWPVALAGAALLAWAAWVMLRRPDGVGAVAALAAAAALGATLAFAGSAAAVLRRFPLPTPHTPPVHVGFLLEHCDYRLPVEAFTTDLDKSYDIFYQWVLRMRFIPRVRATLADARRDRLLVVINPSETFPPEDVAALRSYLESGGRAVVLLRADGSVSAAQSLLAPFGLGVVDAPAPAAGPLATVDGRPAGIVTRGWALAGGTPLLLMNGAVVAVSLDVGRGKLAVLGVGDAFRDAEMGCSNAAPLAGEMLAHFTMEYELLDVLRQYLPENVRRQVDADTAWTKFDGLRPWQAETQPPGASPGR